MTQYGVACSNIDIRVSQTLSLLSNLSNAKRGRCTFEVRTTYYATLQTQRPVRFSVCSVPVFIAINTYSALQTSIGVAADITTTGIEMSWNILTIPHDTP